MSTKVSIALTIILVLGLSNMVLTARWDTAVNQLKVAEAVIQGQQNEIAILKGQQ